MKLTLFLLVLIFGGISASLTVTEEVMSFIMGCQGDREGRSAIPLSRTDVDPDTGTTVQEVTMMDVAQMRDMLQETVESEEVVNYIVGMVERTLHTQQELVARQGCTNVKIDVPPQEVKGLTETIQVVVQQNNYQLLEQVNTLFSFKLNSFYQEVESLLNVKLDQIQALNSESRNVVPPVIIVKTDTKAEQQVEQQVMDNKPDTVSTHNEKLIVLKTEEPTLSVQEAVESVKVEEPVKITVEEVVVKEMEDSNEPESVDPENLRTEQIREDAEVLSVAVPESEPEGDYVPEPEKEHQTNKKSEFDTLQNPSTKVASEPEPEPEPKGDYVPVPDPEPQLAKKPKIETQRNPSPKTVSKPEPEPAAEPEPEADPAPEAEPEPTPSKKPKREPPVRSEGIRRPPSPVVGAAPLLKSRVPPRRISLSRHNVNQESRSDKVEEFINEETNIDEDVNKEQEEETTGLDPRRRRMEAMLAQRRKMANRFREG